MKRIAMLCVLLAGCGSNKDAPVRLVLAQGSLGHMPVALTDALGFYEQEGVRVVLEVIPNPAKAVEALLANSADAAVALYEVTLQLAADGRALRSFALISIRDVRGIVALPRHKEIRSIGDLKGRNLGVGGLGSSTHSFVKYILSQSGMRPEDVSIAGIGLGRTAITAIERGVVDAASVSVGDLFHFKFRYPDLIVLADSSTPEGSRAIYGSEVFPTVALLARSEWLDQHPGQAPKLTRALRRTLKWIDEHSAEEIRERTPLAYRTDDRDAEVESLRRMKTIWSKDGVMPVDGPATALHVMAVTNEKVRDAKIDLSKTYTNEFVKESR